MDGLRVPVVSACLLAMLLAGCGGLDDAKRAGEKEIAKVERQFNRLQRKVAREVDRTLARLERVVPRADKETVVPSRRASASLADFENAVLVLLRRYWTRTFRAAGLPASRARHVFIAVRKRARTRCTEGVADARSAFYCPADDTIFFGDTFATIVGRKTGDFGVAYYLAHEYGHNVQAELGWDAAEGAFPTVAPFEQQADCLAGVWAYSVYRQGLIGDDEVDSAIAAALFGGDLEFDSPDHHGTPEERAAAFLAGYDTGDPVRCRDFVPVT